MMANAEVTVVMYHYVRPIAGSSYPGIKGLEVAGFRKQLDFLASRFNAVSASQLVESCQGGAPLPERPMLLTFDDGYADHYLHAFPELIRRGLPASFFPVADAALHGEMLDVNKIHFALASTPDLAPWIARMDAAIVESFARPADGSAFVEELRAKYHVPNRFDTADTIYVKRLLQFALAQPLRTRLVDEFFASAVAADPREFGRELYMDAEQLREMVAAGMEVGGHGLSHRWLDQLDEAQQRHEITGSLGFLATLGVPASGRTFCYPYGAYNEVTLRLLAELGCQCAFTTKVGTFQAHAQADLLQVPRMDTNDFPQA